MVFYSIINVHLIYLNSRMFHRLIEVQPARINGEKILSFKATRDNKMVKVINVIHSVTGYG